MKMKSQMNIDSISIYQSGAEREKSMFRTFMNREYNPKRETDSKVMAIIIMYEEQKYKLMKEMNVIKKDMDMSKKHFQDADFNYSKLNRELEDQKIENQTLKNRLKYLEQHSSLDHNKILNSIAQQLSLRSYDEILPAIYKMQQVLLALPNVDKFVTAVCDELFDENSSLGSNKLDKVLPEIKQLKQSSLEYNEYRNKLRDAYGDSDPRDIVGKVKGLSHFCRLFDVKKNDDIINVVEGVFFFVHELKLFLAVILI